MQRSIGIFVGLSFVGLSFLGLTVAMAFRLVPEHLQRRQFRWLLGWFLKGFVLPSAIWMLMNIGLSWDLQAFMPQVQWAQNQKGGAWFAVFLKIWARGFFIISSYWMAVTLAWGLVRAFFSIEGESRSDFKGLAVTCLLGMILPSAGVIYLGGWPILGFGFSLLLLPIAANAPNILNTRKIPPMYARAVAKLKFGKYSEAEWEIIHELEKCEDDFEGWMMLAELYATQFNDLREAEQTVMEICDNPHTTPSQLGIGLHRLADWYLKQRGDPEAAKRALNTILERLPGTHLAHMAQLRINQLPGSAEELREQRASSPIHLPSLGDQMDEPVNVEENFDREKSAQQANACVEKLNQDPNNVAAREKLARILTERLNKPELGIEQLTLLLNMEDQPDSKRAEWLSMTAAWHIRYREDLETGRGILERVVQEFPNTPQALAAKRRIRLLQIEASK